jgi:hypothetical protein
MAGRRTKRTPETAAKICEAIRKGVTYKLACDYAGICFETFNEWRKADPAFSDQVKDAEGEGVVELIDIIRQSARENWTAAAWILERRYPQDYGRRVHEHQGKDGEELKFAVTWATASVPKADEGEGSE